MTWVKLSDTFAEDPRWDDLGTDCLALHVAALCYCSRQRTNGILTRARAEAGIAVADPRAVADALIAAKFWKPIVGDRIEIVGYLDDQLSKVDIEKAEAFARIRQRRKRQHAAGDHRLCSAKYCHFAHDSRDATRDDTRDQRHPDPTRPDRREGEGEGEGVSALRSPAGSLRDSPKSEPAINLLLTDDGGQLDVTVVDEGDDLDDEVEQ